MTDIRKLHPSAETVQGDEKRQRKRRWEKWRRLFLY
jgi:hypothetical protein